MTHAGRLSPGRAPKEKLESPNAIFNTLRAGPPTRLSIPRLRLHTSSSTSYLGPPLLIYISLGVLSLDPGGHGAAVLPCVVLFFLCSLFPPTLDPSTCLVVPQAVGKHWPRFARPFRTHPKRPSMATEWQEKRQQCRVHVVVRVIWYARPTVFLTPRWLLDHPKRKMIQNDVLTSQIDGFDSSRLKITQN